MWLLPFFLALWSPTHAAPLSPGLMNAGGVPYTISNPPGSTKDWKGTPGSYSTNFMENVKGDVDYFDVYGEVQTRYSQVYWTRNAPINLPPALVERFKGKVMAITGYEVDQVTHSRPEPSSTTKEGLLGGFSCYQDPTCSTTDKSVPIYNAYNHHYFSWLTGSDAELYERKEALKMPNPTFTGFRDSATKNHTYPTNIVFKENPGGEFRKSYHGYPSGYAQLLHSPSQWLVEPMQIDTHNRKYDINAETGLKPWFLPSTDHNNMTDLESQMSPLIECPCTDRFDRIVTKTSQILTQKTCPQTIASLADCTAAVAEVASVASSSSIHDASKPAGCSMQPTAKGTFNAIFNAAKSTAVCGTDAAPALMGSSDLGGLVNISLSHTGGSSATATITLIGPAGVWFGVGFNAEAMADLPYAIIVDGTGKVTERKLGSHAPGSELASSVKVVSSETKAGVRTVVLTRALPGASKEHYTIPTIPGEINMITAVGSTPNFSYHKSRTSAKLALLPTHASACLCKPVTSTQMTYMNKTTSTYKVDCVDEPRGDMLRHGDGTGRDVPNAACNMQTYHGGLKCCAHQNFLTDRAQGAENTTVDTYFLKWRYYFQEYTPPSSAAPASHQHLHHWVFLIDAQVNDYEEDNAHYGTQSIGKIEAHLKASDIGLEDIGTQIGPAGGKYSKIKPLVMTPHCHAPSCIREEFWNADTNTIICNVTAKYGDEKWGATTQTFNEANYIAIPPCIFGDQPGLQTPFEINPDTNIRAIKYFNNTFRHLGQMAQWTGLMVYDTDPF